MDSTSTTAISTLLAHGNVQLLHLFQHIPVGIAILRGPEHSIEFANDAMLRFWELPDENILNRPLLEVFPTAIAQGFGKILDQVYETGAPYTLQEIKTESIRNNVTRTHYLNLDYYLLRDGEGTLPATVIILNDVTATVLARKATEENEERLRLAIESAQMGTWDYNPLGKVLVCCDRTREIFGFQPTAIITLDLVIEAIDEADRSRVRQAIGQTLQPGSAGVFELEYTVINQQYGSRHMVRTRGQAYFDELGEAFRFIGTCLDITQQKRAEEDLKRFKFMADHATDAFILMRENGTFAYLNALALQRWGYTPEEAQLIRVPDVDPIYTDAVFSQAFTKAQNQPLPPFETLHQRKDGTLFPVEVSMGGLRLNGEPHLFAVARDITDKKQLAAELLRFERIAEYSHDLIGACDLQGVPIYINPEGLRLVGLEDIQAAQAVKFTDFFFPEDADFVERELIPQVMREDYAEVEIRLRHFKTQAPIWMNYAVFTVKNDADEIVSVATISRNIDERKNTQKALRLSLERFHLLADSMPQFVWTGDEQGNLNYFNQSVYAYSGLSPEQVAQHGWLQIVHPDDRAENVEKWLEAVASGEVFFMEHRFRRYDGEYRWQLSRALAQKDRDGKVQMWVGTSTDIHEQKTFLQDLEQQVYARTQDLREANEELERMNRELTAFAYTSSHDLQAPLRKIQAFGSRLIDKENDNLSIQGQEYLRRIQNAAQQMQTLIEDLLAYSRTGTTEKNFEDIDLQALLQEVTGELEQIIYEKRAVIDIGPLPTLRITPFQFRQLFSNLLGNALKFAKKDQPPHIKVRAAQQAGSDIGHPAAQAGRLYHHLTVADNGIGFDPVYSARIFEVFQRLHGKHDYSGTGIGLAICKKIVESHHGFITATSVPGEGATFHIYLPDKSV